MLRPLFAGALLVLAAAMPAAAAMILAPGESRFEFVDAKGQPERPITVHAYRPAACDARCPLVIVMAGVRRNALDYLRFWKASADRYRLVVVAPEFSKQHWPKAAAYNLGDIAAHPADASKWSYSGIEHLFDEVGQGRPGYVLFGHSAGGQFVHRMALFLPGARATMMVAANPGWYTMPEWRVDRAAHPYPYSLVGAPAGEAGLKQALQRPLTLMLGTRDVDAHDHDLNHSAGADAEGPDRFSRGQAFFTAAQRAARDTDASFAWRLVEVPGVAHEGAAMSRAAAHLLFGKAG